MSFDLLSLLATATLMTLGLAVASLIGGLILSIIFAVLEGQKHRWISVPMAGATMLMRGLPEILVVFLIYFGLAEVIEIPSFWLGTLALSLIFAAYASQTLRGAIKAIPIGQWESGSALGLSRAYIFSRIVLPQVWRHALPGLSNQWLVLLKDTALVSLIGIDELMRQATVINATTHQPFTWYSIAALIYLMITLVSQFGIKHLERYFTRFERGEA